MKSISATTPSAVVSSVSSTAVSPRYQRRTAVTGVAGARSHRPWSGVPSKAANPDLAKKFVELATSPQVQAEGIVKQFNLYPGIDAEHVQDALDEATWQKLFADVTPEELASKGKPFPIGPYFDDIQEAYERKVEN